MILTADEINRQVIQGAIRIEPYSQSNLNPNSYNFSLGEKILVYKNPTLDSAAENETLEIIIPQDGIVLNPGELYLGSSLEAIGGDKFIPLIYGRSSIGRMGLFVQITAPLGDIGFFGRWTLQLTPIRPIRVYPGMKIGQVMFIVPYGKIELYKGKYQGACGPIASRIHIDK